MRGDKTTRGATAQADIDEPATTTPSRSLSRSLEPRNALVPALWVIALTLIVVAIMVGVKLFFPGSAQPVLVQFSDLSGRVQLEYCPSLPASFEGTAFSDDLRGEANLIPVKVSGEICGDTRFTEGVWIYLHRGSVTLASETRG